MSPPYTLLSGATGFLGMHILKQLLESDHKVRIVSRSQEKGEHVKQFFQAYASQISVVVMEDQLATGAYDTAAQDVEAIIHTASPFIMNAEDNQTELLDPAKKMTHNMLNAAAKSATVKRVVITSSLAAVANPFEGGLLRDYTYTPEDFNPITEDQAEGPALGYLASKTVAERAAWEFMKTPRHFDLVTICPSLIIGPPLQEVKSMKGLNTSCASIYGMFDIQEINVNPFPFMVSAEDVSKAHVRAVDEPEAGGKRFVTAGSLISTQAVVDAMRAEYPQLRSRMTAGNPGKNEFEGTTVCKIDSSAAEKVLGVQFRGWEEMIVKDTVPALLKLEEQLKT